MATNLSFPPPNVYHSNRAFTPQVARASKWPEVIHFQCEPAASSGESGVFWAVRASRRVEIRSTLW